MAGLPHLWPGYILPDSVFQSCVHYLDSLAALAGLEGEDRAAQLLVGDKVRTEKKHLGGTTPHRTVFPAVSRSAVCD